MQGIERRRFLKHTGTAGALAATWAVPSVRAAGADDRITIGVVGCTRGVLVAKALKPLGADIAYICDTDADRMDRAHNTFNTAKCVGDFRRILDDKSVDAVVIATPDHWHGPAAIMASDAGKHVYVEKPCSHNIREGRLMIEAARRNKRVMQVGSQSRSTTILKNAIQHLRDGAIGQVLAAKAWNSQKRANIGHKKPSKRPPRFDYDLWVGPAPMRPFQSNCHHYTWHWWYDFGTGDAGNDGVHELDIAAWGLDLKSHPSLVAGHGSKMFFDDDQQFPDTQYVTYEYPAGDGKKPILLIYEQRLWSPYLQEGYENGNTFYGTEGYLTLSKHVGWRLYGKRNKLIREEKGTYSVPEHAADFLDSIRRDRRPNADIAVGHLSATMVHLANILARSGQPAFHFDPKKERIVNNPEADALVRRTYRKGHWAVPKGV